MIVAQERKMAEDLVDSKNLRESENLQQTLESLFWEQPSLGKRPELSFATLTLVSLE